MHAAASRPVPLPVPNPLQSYWQTPPHLLSTHRSTETLPPTTDIAILGTGISGASLAHHLSTQSPRLKILLLEARSACSGATGRNGGHTKPGIYRFWADAVHNHGLPTARRIASLAIANVQAQRDLAAELHLDDCNMTATPTVDIIYDAHQLAAAKRTIAHMAAHAPDVFAAEGYEMFDARVAEERFLCPGAAGAILYRGGSVSAHAFVLGMLEWTMERSAGNVNLQTYTPVTSLSRGGEGGSAWTLHTPRGDVTARNVALATNGYTANLLPAFQGTIVPLRGQAVTQRPGMKLVRPLEATYTFSYETGYEYMIQRPVGAAGEGDIVIGGGWSTLPDGGECEFGLSDDSEMNKDISKYLFESTARYFGSNWGDDDAQGRTKIEWTGIMGTSADGWPYVGEVPGQEGLWLSASFNGSGMTQCFKCAEALATMMVGSEEQKTKLDEWFPDVFRMREERLNVPFKGRRHQKPQDFEL